MTKEIRNILIMQTFKKSHSFRFHAEILFKHHTNEIVALLEVLFFFKHKGVTHL